MKKINPILFFLVLITSSIAEESFFDQAKHLFEQNRVENANEIIELLKEEIEINENNANGLKLLGIMYQQVGEYELALTRFEEFEELNKNHIDTYVLYNRAACYYMLNKYNKAKHILAVNNALLMNTDSDITEYSNFYKDIIQLSRLENLGLAYNIIESKYNISLMNYVFIAIDENNYNDCKNDSEILPFLRPQFDLSHGWMNILLIPLRSDIQNRFCLYLNWEVPEYFVSVDIKDIRGTSIEESYEIIENSKIIISEDFVSKLNLTSVSWQSGEVISDDGNKITAYTLVK